MKKTSTKSNPPSLLPSAEIQAAALLKQLEQERGKDTLSMGKAVKGYPTRQKIFDAEPAVQVEFVRQIVATIAKLGKSKGKGKIPMFSAWFNDLKVPFGAEEVAKQLLRRRLPFTDAMLAEMLEQIGRMDFIGFAPALEPLVRELEKRSKETGLPPRIRKNLRPVMDGLLVKGWPAAAIDNWGLPAAADRKLAARIKHLVR